MYYINKLKVKELRVMLRYHFGLEKLKGSPKKVDILEAVTDFFIKDWEDIVRKGGV